MSLSVLIVDDEKHIRAGLAKWLSEYGDRFGPVREAKNADEALAILVEFGASLTISDIRMPDRDGISFMREVTELGLQTEFLLISGFDEFEYARSAISYGARGYLLKPIDRSEFTAALNRIVRMIEDRREVDAFTASGLAKSVIADDFPSAEAMSSFFAALRTLPPKGRVRLAKFFGAPGSSTDTANSLSRAVPSAHSVWLFNDTDGQAIFSLEGVTPVADLARFAEGQDRGFFLALSSADDAPDQLGQLLGECRVAAKYSRILYPLRFAVFGDLPGPTDDPPLPLGAFKLILDRIGAIPVQETLAETKRLLPPVGQASYLYYPNAARIIGSMLYEFLDNAFPDIAAILKKETGPIGNFDAFQSLSAYQTQLENCILALDGRMADLKAETRDKRSIDAAVRILREQYSDLNLTMYAVAEEVGLSYSYFSHLFKLRTGQSFLSYLKRLRTSRAKDFLETSNDTISKIAVCCGFSSTRMLRAAFEDIYGLTPAEYRAKGGRLNRQSK
jgi:two-component system response regulator YesN